MGPSNDQTSQARLLSAEDQLRTAIGAGQFPFVAAWTDAALATARVSLGDEAFERQWNAGRELPLDAVVAEATRILDAPAGPGPLAG